MILSTHPLRALRARDFRIYFAGQLVSVAGTWMQQIAMAWLTYRLTDSVFMLGLLGFASQAPILVFGPLGGVWADRLDRRTLMMWTQTLAMAQALVLAVLAWQGWATPALLLGLAFVLGCVNAVDVPARQSLVVHLVGDRTVLPNAIALNSFMMNATRFVGPALAGFIVAWAGEAVCFLLNALSYLAVLLALMALHARPGGDASKRPLHALREGLVYTFGHRDIRRFLLLVAMVSFLIAPYVVMMPLYARTMFHGDARTLGLLVSSAGAGSLSAALFLASRTSIAGLARRVSLAAALAGLALALFALNEVHALAYPILMVLGFSVVLVAAGSNTLLQSWVRDDMRGRVMATFSMAFLGVAPLGSLAVGSLAHVAGIRPTLFLCGLAALLGGLAHRRAQARSQ
ncbi:MFS transporter [Parasulfuritortus cantonensis]|uniref:MFS transporter n=1 Tax=Parasulfuritortus cantonensis TaxID=2528202 RepID=A0A4R1BD43_9PROT|nr:MFS transporter [Parasulfuritortus cantonensis]TCJ14991.1 MFS transporter [Parasulfuritortus cantonensis]